MMCSRKIYKFTWTARVENFLRCIVKGGGGQISESGVWSNLERGGKFPGPPVMNIDEHVK